MKAFWERHAQRALAQWRVVAVVLVAAGVAVTLWTLRNAEERAHRAPDRVNQLRAELYRESALEWAAIAQGEVGPDALTEHRKAVGRIDELNTALAELPSATVASTRRAVRVYVTALDDEITLLAEGRVGEAEAVDEERVDPAFEGAVDGLDSAHQAAVERAQWIDRVFLGGSLSAIALAAGLSAILLAGQARSRREAIRREERVATLEEATRRQEEFAAIAAHELRTPLTGIVGSLEMLRRAADAPALADHFDEVLGIGLSQTRRLRRICEDLEIVARPDGSALRLGLAPVPVKAAVDAAVCDLGGDAPERVRIEVGGEVWAFADPDRLVQVIANLVRNALRASPEELPVRASARVDGARVEIAVEDHGPGIEPDRIEALFERFGGGSRSGGFGIGLAVVGRLVAAMGGEVRVASTLGEGSCFTVRLPIASPFDGEPAAAGSVPVAASP